LEQDLQLDAFQVRDFDKYRFKLTILFPHSINFNLISSTTFGVAYYLNEAEELPNEQKRLLCSMLAPFKLLVLRSAQQVPRVARASSMMRLPKDLCRMVGDMFVE
jgi:hypothetical protein